MNLWSWIRVVAFGMLVLLVSDQCFAQASAAGEIVEEGVELLAKQLGKQSAEDLAAMGGRAGLREVLDKAAAEGGETLVRKTTAYGVEDGVLALRVIARSPARIVAALDRLAPELRPAAINAIEREPEAVMPLLSTYGPEVVEVAAKQPGVGVQLIEKLGIDGLKEGESLTTDQAILLARHADEIKNLPTAEREVFWDSFRKSPGKVLDYTEKHPGVLKSGTRIAVAGVMVAGVYAMADNLFGPAAGPSTGLHDPPAPRSAYPTGGGFFGNLADKFLFMFRTPLSAILYTAAGAIALWAAIHLWGSFATVRMRLANAANHASATQVTPVAPSAKAPSATLPTSAADAPQNQKSPPERSTQTPD